MATRAARDEVYLAREGGEMRRFDVVDSLDERERDMLRRGEGYAAVRYSSDVRGIYGREIVSVRPTHRGAAIIAGRQYQFYAHADVIPAGEFVAEGTDHA